MAAKSRKPVEALRVPLNCLVLPWTKEEIMERAINGKSQGKIVDDAISALYRETGTAYDPRYSRDEATLSEASMKVIESAKARVRNSGPHTPGLPAKSLKGLAAQRGIRQKGDRTR